MMDEAAIRLALRVTARISLLFFAGAFAGCGAHALWPSTLTAWLARNTNRLIVSLAASHTLHLAAIISLAAILGERFVQETTWIGIILGGLVYLLIYALAIVALGPEKNFGWLSSRRFQSAAMYAIWFVFATAFIGGTFRRVWTYLPFAILTVAALAVRIVGNRRLRSRSASTAFV
ncbi:MAG: hypothetical protein L0Z53_05060 [Acidobacteriales bacterium]|nr:hypothetical protein [Terriglobales bacterium]